MENVEPWIYIWKMLCYCYRYRKCYAI